MIATTSQPAQTPPDSASPPVTVGEGSFFAFVSAVVFFLLHKGWEYLQAKTKREEKREDSELSATDRMLQQSVENNDKLLNQLQEGERFLLNEVINRNDEAVKTLQANLVTLLGVQSATHDNLKHYNEAITKSLDRTLDALKQIDNNTSRSLVEALSTQARLYADLKQNQFLLNAKLDKLHYRLDKHFGPDQDV